MNILLKILDEKTALTKDHDLFYLEIPLDTSGAWFSDSTYPSRFNGVNTTEYDIYVRGKDKSSTEANITYLKNTLDAMTTAVCSLDDGTTFRIEMTQGWSYLEKDSEGYFVFASKIKLWL